MKPRASQCKKSNPYFAEAVHDCMATAHQGNGGAVGARRVKEARVSTGSLVVSTSAPKRHEPNAKARRRDVEKCSTV